MRRNIGIDFGTTNTIITFRDAKGKLKKMGGKSIKSAVYFYSKNEYIIGQDAIEQSNICSEALVENFKPNINGPKYTLIAENGEKVVLKPSVVARMFLNKILVGYIQPKLLDIYHDGELTDEDKIVITVPVKFNPEEKALIKKSAQMAFYPNVSLAFEPTAAAVASAENFDDDVVAVYDFGGGTFDISVIEKVGGGKFIPIEEGGDKELGGNRVTSEVAEKIVLKVLEKNGKLLPIDENEFDEDDYGMTELEYRKNMKSVMKTADEIKMVFSDEGIEPEQEFLISVEEENSEPMQYKFTVTLEEYNSCIRPLVEKTVELTRKVIDIAQNEKNKCISRITMAGGSSLITLSYELLKAEFEKDNIEIKRSVDVFDLISKGAQQLAEKESLISIEEKTVAQFGVAEKTGIGVLKFHELIKENCKLPASGSKEYIIDDNMLNCGELEIKCFERDIKAYPNALTVRDKGMSFINIYKIKIDKLLNPKSVFVTFSIDTDGTLGLSAILKDSDGKELKKIDTEITAESDLE